MAKKLLTRAELAALMLVTPMTITRWESDGMPVAKKAPRGKPSMFNPDAVERWRAEIDAQKLEGEDGISLELERAKLAQKQREKIELDLAVRRGELVLRDQVVREGLAFVKGWTAKVRSLAKRASLAGIVERDKVPELEVLCRDLLIEATRWKTVADTTKNQGKPRGRAKGQ